MSPDLLMSASDWAGDGMSPVLQGNTTPLACGYFRASFYSRTRPGHPDFNPSAAGMRTQKQMVIASVSDAPMGFVGACPGIFITTQPPPFLYPGVLRASTQMGWPHSELRPPCTVPHWTGVFSSHLAEVPKCAL